LLTDLLAGATDTNACASGADVRENTGAEYALMGWSAEAAAGGRAESLS